MAAGTPTPPRTPTRSPDGSFEGSLSADGSASMLRSKWKPYVIKVTSTEDRSVQGKQVTMYRVSVLRKTDRVELAHKWARYSEVVDAQAAMGKVKRGLPNLPSTAVRNNKAPEVLKDRAEGIGKLLETAKNSRLWRNTPAFKALVLFEPDDSLGLSAATIDSVSPLSARDTSPPVAASPVAALPAAKAADETVGAVEEQSLPVGSGVTLSTAVELVSSSKPGGDSVPAGTVCRVVGHVSGGSALVETREWRFQVRADEIDTKPPPTSSVPPPNVVERPAGGPVVDALPFTTQAVLSTVSPPVELAASAGWQKKNLPSSCSSQHPTIASRVTYEQKPVPIQATPAVRLSAEVNCTPNAFARYLKHDNREAVTKQYDDLIDRVVTHESMGKKGDVCQNLLTSPSRFVSPRDFVYYTVGTQISPEEMQRRGIARGGAEGSLGYVVGARSVENKKAPPGGKWVRGRINVMGYIAVPVGESKIHLTEVNAVDAGVALPAPLLAKAEEIKAKRFVRLVDCIEKFFRTSPDPPPVKSEHPRPFRHRQGMEDPTPQEPEPEPEPAPEEEEGGGEVPEEIPLAPPPPPQKPSGGVPGGALGLLVGGGVLAAAGLAYSRRSAAQEKPAAVKSKL
eukprot:Hpha_TRINITY_DN13070_c0_g2::TRINITY_DN13070_c0_g2_i1::g.68860::m.68860